MEKIKEIAKQIDSLKLELIELYKKNQNDEIYFSIIALINAKQHLLKVLQ